MIAGVLVAAALAAAPSATIRTVVNGGRDPWIDRAPSAAETAQLRTLYEPGAYAPLWSEDGRPRALAGEAEALLTDAAAHGLRPDDYDAPRLAARWNAAASGSNSPEDLGLLDVATTLQMLRYLSDLHVGRVDPRDTSVSFDRPAHAHPVAPLLAEALATDRVRALPDRLEPSWPQYRSLLKALARYRQIAAGPALPEFAAASGLRPGDTLVDAGVLVARLKAFGDLNPGAVPSAGPVIYDGELVAAVKSFQERHGLAVDGVIGTGTLAALNVSPSSRVRQIARSLERLRWIPDIPAGPVIVVNVPSFRLWAFDTRDDAGRALLTMPVIVGRAVKTETPIFFGTMTYLVFRPYWNVPPSILVNEVVPALRRDPGYLEANDMEIVRDFAAAPGASLPVNDETIAALAARRYAVRQRPGPRNSLGRVKFIFPNSESVYLHDTPAQALFERARRDFSHGCVRVGDPEALAEFVLRGKTGWDRARIEAAFAGPPNATVGLAVPVPVLIFYTTAYASPDGRVYFTEDVYGLDRKLDAALADQRG